jgi:hypothetical protein
MPPARFLLDNDDDGHWYLIPVELHQQFTEYVCGEREMDLPDGVMALGSGPTTVTFEMPEYFGKSVA